MNNELPVKHFSAARSGYFLSFIFTCAIQFQKTNGPQLLIAGR